MADEPMLEMPINIKGSSTKLRGTWNGDKLMVWGTFEPDDPILFIRHEDRAAMAQCSIAAGEARVAALEAELDNARLKLMALKIGAGLKLGQESEVDDTSVASSSSASSSAPTDWLQQWRTESFLAKETALRQARTEPPEHKALPSSYSLGSLPDPVVTAVKVEVPLSDTLPQPQAPSAAAVEVVCEPLPPEPLFPELPRTWARPLTGTPSPEPTEPPSDQPGQIELPL
jgi:hypothetical protein